ncbi:MAG: sporulation integral membrane protein YlbJ, partial [Priestia megaterium]
HIGTELSLPFISGLFEITLGSRLASEAPDTLLFHQIIIVSFVLGFSGFSVQAQVASILAETDIRFFPFFIARIFHGCFAVVFTIFLWGPLRESITTFQASEGALPVSSHLESVTILSQWLNVYGPLLTIFTLCCYIYIYSKRTFLHRSQ